MTDMTVREGRAPMSDGAEIFYKIWGNPNPERRILLVHSLAMTADFWAETAAAGLAASAEVLAVDCRGHGRSSKPAGSYTVEQMADDLAALMDQIGWDSTAIAGASMGGCISLTFAGRPPSRTRALGMIDTTAGYGPEAVDAWEGRATKGLTEGMASMIGFQKSRWFSEKFIESNPDKVAAAIEVFVANDPAAYAESCRMLGRCDQKATMAILQMPATILVGEEDYATPVVMAEELYKGIAGSTLHVMPNVRHFTPLEVPGVIAAHLTALLDRV